MCALFVNGRTAEIELKHHENGIDIHNYDEMTLDGIWILAAVACSNAVLRVWRQTVWHEVFQPGIKTNQTKGDYAETPVTSPKDEKFIMALDCKLAQTI